MRDLALALAVGLLIGWTLNGWRLGNELANTHAVYERANAFAQAQARKTESAWQTKLDQEVGNAQASIETAVLDAAAADTVADGLRKELDRIKRRASTCPSTAGTSPTTPSTTDVLTDLLSKVEAAGRELAAEADARRVAGLTCERSWPANLE